MGDVVAELREGARLVVHVLAASYDACHEMEIMRGLLARQWKADEALYSASHDIKKRDHIAMLNEHDAAHKAIGDYLAHNA